MDTLGGGGGGMEGGGGGMEGGGVVALTLTLFAVERYIWVILRKRSQKCDMDLQN